MSEEYNQKTELNDSLPNHHAVANELGMSQVQGHYGDFTAENVAELFGQIGGSKFNRVFEMAKTQLGEHKNH